MRDAIFHRERRPAKINPLIPVEPRIDHSVQVDEFASRLAIGRNVELEFERNKERRFSAVVSAFDNFVVPPNTGTCTRSTSAFARVVESRDGMVPDSWHRLAHDDDQRAGVY